jgi:hypothetical protein
MELKDLFMSELRREADRTRHVLEQVPAGCAAWQPSEKAMPLGLLSSLIAVLPERIAMILRTEGEDIREREKVVPRLLRTSRELVQVLDHSVEEAYEELRCTSEAHLCAPWRILSDNRTIGEQARHFMIRDTVFSQLSHLRGELTVYLRLNETSVSGLYNPRSPRGRSFRSSAPQRYTLGLFL